MKIQQKLIIFSAVLLIMSDSFPVKADELPENTAIVQETSVLKNNGTEEESILLPDKSESSEPSLSITENADSPAPSLSTTEDTDESEPSLSTTENADESEPSLSTTEDADESEPSLSTTEDADKSEPSPVITEGSNEPDPSPVITEGSNEPNPSPSIAEDTDASEPSLSITADMNTPVPLIAEETDAPSPAEAPMFYAVIEYYSHGYYIVKGTFTEFLPDTTLVRPLYSLDGENWQSCGRDWDLSGMGKDDETALTKLHNQICLNNSDEPLKSYLNGDLDSFYIKLHITRENGESYETQAAIIERGEPQPISKEINLIANFIPSMRVREMKPFRTYGRYQITIKEDAAPEDVSAFLPDTLPITVGLYQGIDFITEGTIDCPITWKPLSFSQLTAGESITISDAAEEIIIPGGTLLNTPMGIFQLDEPIGLNQDVITDEIQLVLNVVSEHENPTGVLIAENNGLELAFSLKPTGATAIRAYTLSANDTEWKELPALPLLDAVNAQPSTANSGYTLVIHRDWEPYQSYLSATASEESPAPFLIGLEIEGGVYDDRQLILPWPSSYEPPLNLPVLGGSGGNEGNAGADNKNDSTEEGQRPELPQQPAQEPDNTSKDSLPAPTQIPDDTSKDSLSAPIQISEDQAEEAQPLPSQNPETKAEEDPSQNSTGKTEEALSAPIQKPEDKTKDQNQTQSQTSENIRTEQPLNPLSNPELQTDSPAETNTADHEKSAHETQQNRNREQAATNSSSENEYLAARPAADTETENPVPFLPIAAASVAGICIVTAIHKTAVRRSAGTP